MLRLRKLEVEGFGPFADPQVVTFPDEPGVIVIYGENMRGKTTLLNAIRYAFFGIVLGRRGGRGTDATPMRLHTLSNRDRAAEGTYGFSTSLVFDYDGDEYELVRECAPRRGISVPTSDADYEHDVLLRKGTAALGPGEKERLLQQMFPAEVSRFFLFDGELLEEYESLLVHEGTAGKELSEAIERILGVPILTRGRSHLLELADRADRSAAKEAQKSAEHNVIGKSLQTTIEQKAAHQQERLRLVEQLQAHHAKRLEIEQYLATQGRYSALLEEKRTAETRLEAAAQEEINARADLQRAMADAWRSLLKEPVKLARANAQADADKQVGQLIASLRKEAITSGHCGTCDQDVPEPARAALASSLPDTPFGDADTLTKSMARLADLSRFTDRDNAGEIRQLWKRAQDLLLEQVSLRDRIADRSTALADSDPDMILRSKVSYSEVAEKISEVKRAIEKTVAEELERDAAIQRFNRKLETLGSPEYQAHRLQANTLKGAAAVFNAAVETYKAELRARVEATASKLFRSMTTEKEDYAGLTINDGYGLTIRHRDGQAEEARSAGAEHVVALALMGALQNNAPLRGPIVMDSPFGRLDEKHTSNVINTLPDMASQVILLVYESEVKGKERVREILKAKLIREYILERVSGRKTNVKEVR